MTVARVGDTLRCAQFMVTWIMALKMPSPSATTISPVDIGGTDSPAGTIVANATSDAVVSCTTVTRLTSTFPAQDRKSTRLNSSHVKISYAVFCLKKKNK